MYNSLYNACDDFHLYIFAFDNTSETVLKQLKLENITIISLSEFEDTELLQIKQSRSKAEYCWTSTPSSILYCLLKYKLNHCTYIDSDIYFYCNPAVLLVEMGDNDVLLTEHRYTPEYDRSKLAGKYCVQFMCFKNTPNGLNILNWWREACLEWCFNREEDGKFGDQMYLDDWTERFKGVHVLEHLGGGVAPWNVQQYEIVEKHESINGIVKISHSTFDLVFYHFHHLRNQRINFINEFYLGPYLLSDSVIRYLYEPYIEELKKTYRFLKSLNPAFDSLGSAVISQSYIRLLGHIIKNSFRRNKKIWLK
jgi:hypothetical protein